MKISHNQLVNLIKECMMDMNIDYPPTANSLEVMPIRKPRKNVIHLDNIYGARARSGRMLDYGMHKSDSQEGRMAKSNLARIIRMASEIHDVLHDEDDMPEWVQDKLATVKDRLESCHSYLMYELENYNENE